MQDFVYTPLPLPARRRFVKELSLPIPVLSDPYFEYYLQLYEKLHKSQTKYTQYVETLNRVGGEGRLTVQISSVISEAIKAVTETPGYIRMNSEVIEPPRDLVATSEIYQMGNHGKEFISLDLVKANFLSLRTFDPTIVFGATSYEEFLSRFTTERFLFQSKQLRQVIFGKMNPKKQQNIQKQIIHKITQALVSNGIPLDHFVTASSDELVIRCSPEYTREKLSPIVTDTLASQLNDLENDIRAVSFKMESIEQRKFFAKKTLAILNPHRKPDREVDDIELKAIPGYFLAQVYKRYLGQPIEEYDRVFTHANQIAFFAHSIFEDRTE